MSAIVDKALNLWGMSGAAYHLVAARENRVFKVTAGKKTYALRLHRQGYREDQELWSELKWMDAAAQGGIVVPAPICSASGEMLHVVDGIQIDVLTWLSGTTMDKILTGMNSARRTDLFRALGQEMARLHTVSDAWQPPDGFVRCAWDRDGLVGESPLWDRFWENPALTTDDRHLLKQLRETANSALEQIEQGLDYALIHADLVSANVMVDGNQLQLIDFDDGGFGFRLFDIATALLKFVDDDDYPALRAALLSGYASQRDIDLVALDLFIVLRAATYVGWNIARMSEDGAKARNTRFITRCRGLARDYLASA